MSRTPSVALIVDNETWAFANIARQLVRYLSDDFSFRIIPAAVIEDVNQLLLMTADADLRHIFWRGLARQIGKPPDRHRIERLGYPYDLFEARYLSGRKLTTAVYDHLYLDGEDVVEWAGFLSSPDLDGYSVSSQRLYDIYRSLPDCRLPFAVLEDGVDLELFTPQRLDRLASAGGRDLVIGWVGNSAWSAEIDDFKGVHSILTPALRTLRSTGVAVRGYFADRQVRLIPHAEMPAYYAQIDVLVCVSKVEGTPNPVLEAMACGVPIITTDVGVVPQVLGPGQRDLILPERTPEALSDRIVELARHPALLQELSEENLARIRPWGWDIKAHKFRSFFDMVLDS